MGKPTFPHVSCDNGPDGDMFMNYMDYVDDDTMIMFTHGQVTRMQATLDGMRSSIGTSGPCDGGGSIKFVDDPKLKFADDPITLKFRDDGGSLKFRDDVKLPALDKSPAEDVAKPPVADTGIPGGPGPVGQPAPFVLSTPHHSNAWAGTYAGAYRQTISAYQGQLQHYERLLQQYAEAEQAGQLTDQDRTQADQLYAEYQQLVTELQQLQEGQ